MTRVMGMVALMTSMTAMAFVGVKDHICPSCTKQCQRLAVPCET